MALKLLRNKTSKEVVALDSVTDAGEFAAKTGAHWIGTPADVAVKTSAEPAEWEDISAVLGPGGTAFEHLEEDADNSALAADWPLTYGDPSGPFNTKYAQFGWSDPAWADGAYGFTLGGVSNSGSFWYDSNGAFLAFDSPLGFDSDGDGVPALQLGGFDTPAAILFGGGAAPPDISLGYDNDGSPLLFISGPGGPAGTVLYRDYLAVSADGKAQAGAYAALEWTGTLYLQQNGKGTYLNTEGLQLVDTVTDAVRTITVANGVLAVA